MSAFLCVLRVDYVPVVNDDEIVIPGNIEALQYGLEALQKQDAQDFARMKELWALAFDALIQEKESDRGSQANGRLQVEDDMEVACLNDWWGGYYGR